MSDRRNVLGNDDKMKVFWFILQHHLIVSLSKLTQHRMNTQNDHKGCPMVWGIFSLFFVHHGIRGLKYLWRLNYLSIIFYIDNGADVDRYGNNWPLRGSKNTLFEGALRTVGFIHSPLLPSNIQQTRSQAFIHVSDWFPTFVSTLAGGNIDGIKLDGIDVWNAIR